MAARFKALPADIFWESSVGFADGLDIGELVARQFGLELKRRVRNSMTGFAIELQIADEDLIVRADARLQGMDET
jgi:hypothetical protein